MRWLYSPTKCVYQSVYFCEVCSLEHPLSGYWKKCIIDRKEMLMAMVQHVI